MHIDVCLRHASSIMIPLEEVDAEHYGYLEQLNALDFREPAQALFAIRKWLLPGSELWTPAGRYQRREAYRLQLMRGHCVGDCLLPGILACWGVGPTPPALFSQALHKFQLLAWGELFPEEPYEPRLTANYRHRIDAGFSTFPDWPARWGPPTYKAWPVFASHADGAA